MSPSVKHCHGKWFVDWNGLVGPYADEDQAQAWIDAVAHATIGLTGVAFEAALDRAKSQVTDACPTCGGDGVVGRAPDDFWNCPDCGGYGVKGQSA